MNTCCQSLYCLVMIIFKRGEIAIYKHLFRCSVRGDYSVLVRQGAT